MNSTKSRISVYHFLQEYIGVFKGGNRIVGLLNSIVINIQILIKIDRTQFIDKPIAKGAQWFDITDELAKQLIDNKDWIEKTFKNTCCADELFLQMFVKNSSFEENIYKKESNNEFDHIVRYIDWKRGTPYVFQSHDFDDLINSNYMFARKFDIINYPETVYKIYNYLK